MAKRRISTIAVDIEKALRDHPELRDDDRRLVANIWHTELLRAGYDPKATSAHSFFQMYVRGDVTASETITRARRKVQEENQSLRGGTYAQRHSVQRRVVKDIHNYKGL